MRVLSVIPGPAFGGAHNQVRVLNAPLRARGIETTVVLPVEAELAAARLRSAGLDVETRPLHRLRASRSFQPHLDLAKSFRAEIRGLERLVLSKEIDVVQSHGVTNPHGALAARRAGVASLWQIFDSRAPMALRRAAMPLVLRFADASTVWGRALAEMHPGLERLGTRLTVVFPPVETTRFEPDLRRRKAARQELGVRDGEILVGSVGVLNPQKGHEFAIRAAAAVRRKRSDVRFRILGGASPTHESYENSLRDQIQTFGLSDDMSIVDPGTRVDELVQAFDIFLMTSVPRSEGMPTVILEAMVCQKPVVATDVGSVGELLTPGVTGLLVAPEDVDGIARAVLELCEDSASRDSFGKNGRKRALRDFNLDKLADLHAEAYATAVAHNASRS